MQSERITPMQNMAAAIKKAKEEQKEREEAERIKKEQEELKMKEQIERDRLKSLNGGKIDIE